MKRNGVIEEQWRRANGEWQAGKAVKGGAEWRETESAVRGSGAEVQGPKAEGPGRRAKGGKAGNIACSRSTRPPTLPHIGYRQFQVRG